MKHILDLIMASGTLPITATEKAILIYISHRWAQYHGNVYCLHLKGLSRLSQFPLKTCKAAVSALENKQFLIKTSNEPPVKPFTCDYDINIDLLRKYRKAHKKKIHTDIKNNCIESFL
jgi:hypothetical protein